MKFVATDGSVFTDRASYRKYEMETQYTFRNKDSSKLTKLPGSVSGQPFNIADCNDCVITVLDHCDQVQIDNVTKSRIFIGASSESIFIRDCKDCTLTIACKQLRTRDCVNCTLYLHCKTEPIIESSVGMKFAPFNGAYNGHEKAMRDANLDPNHNLWYAVYDFSDDMKVNHNWSYVKEGEEDDEWCPLGPADNCCPRVTKENFTTISLTKDDDDNERCYDGSKHETFIRSKKDANGLNVNSPKSTAIEDRVNLSPSSWKSLALTRYTYFSSQIKALLVDLINSTARWAVSFKDSVLSFFR